VEGKGTSYIDDFENSATPFSLMNPVGWKLAATPKTDDNRYDPSGGSTNDVRSGFKRARIAWYQVDNLFYRKSSPNKPNHITPADLENHYVRAVLPQEVFPYRDPYVGNFYEPVLDVAYYPGERGAYNFNTDLANGLLKNPAGNWAGITSAIRTEVDFDKANIEYVEFWLMDPFIPGKNGEISDGINPPQNNTTGGKLTLHLGSVSEDLMRDGLHAFENGLPTDGNLTSGSVTQNNWGYVTQQQFLTNAFDNSPESRANQDVGLDGVPDEKELTTFQDFLANVPPESRPAVEADPSADDFEYFLSEQHDAAEATVLERYKRFNGIEGNSPVLTGNEDYTPSGGTIPENEDLNADNTLSDVEEYYAYHMDLLPGTLDVGSKFVVDKITNTVNGDAVTWYLFRIPVRQFDEKVGNISDFKSIRYARMVLSGFSQPVVLRFVNFRSVGSRWRRYVATLEDSKFGEPLEPNFDNFSVSVVNIEENGQGSSTKPPYAVPPGINRDRDNTSTVQRRLNEQSLQVCVEGLQDGDGRAAFKNVGMDFFFYGKVEMFLHAHGSAQDDQLVGFVRLGTDPDQNYYEIEVPLKITPPFVGDPDDDAVREMVWPDANRIDLSLEELYALKVRRDREKFPLLQPFPLEGPHLVGTQGIRIVGRPDLSAVKVIMIGVRNPVSTDKLPADVCIWANELRLTDFNRKSGWAGNAVLNARLADFANVTGSVKHLTFGYGDVQSKINERSRDEFSNYDISANINVDKLIPEKAGVKVPMFVSYEKTTIRPQYDPANPDIPLSATLKSFQTQEERDNYEEITLDRTTRKSLNFTNVKKVKLDPQAKSHLYDIENLSFTYAFSEASRTNFNMRENLIRSYRGGVAYTYNAKAQGIEPFKNSDGLKSPWLKLIKDFNFNLVPTSLSVRLDLDRSLNKTLYRNSVNSLTDTANFLKYFRMDRVYNLRWNLTKSLSLEYNARANALIDEPEGDPEGSQSMTREEYRDSVKVNLKKFGRMKNFDQNITLNYTVPLDKLPLTDWLGAEYRHQLSYDWRAGPINQPDSLRFGNITQNARDQALTGRIDMMKLYNKVGYLKRINQPPKPASTRPAAPGVKADTVKAPAQPGKAVSGIMKLLMSVRSINGTYNVGRGTILPGYLPTPWLFGMDKNWEAPGWPFIFGSQDPDIRFQAAEKGWLTKAPALTTPFSQVENKDLSLRASVEPASELKIQLDAKKTSTSAYQEIFRFDETAGDYVSLSPSRSGSYKVSVVSIKTAFRNDNKKVESSAFKEFEQNLDAVQARFSTIVGGGYEKKSQDVVIPAFLSAYTGQDVNRISLSPFPYVPLPNWRVDYTGLSKVKGLKDIFQSITLNHAYSSTYSVVNYTNSLEYDDLNLIEIDQSVEDYNRTTFGTQLNKDGQIIPVYVIGQVMISEQFAPLFGINLRTKKRLSGRFEYKTKRDLALNISNAQITEMNSKDVTLEMGYTKNNMKLPFKSDGRTIVLKNDVTFRLTMSVADNIVIQRKIAEVNTITNGNLNFQLRPNVSYVVNQKLNIQLYFERNINDPQVSNSYRRATTKFGTKILFSLAQ
jgi:cell surface protein SprA